MKSRDEWLQAFDLEFNNVMANLAAPLDDFEISVFLTKAQEQLVIQLYLDKFEGSELNRRCLDSLVRTVDVTPSTSNSEFGGKVFTLPEDVMYITYERAKGTHVNTSCFPNGKDLRVKPVLQDELAKILRNPFKSPSATTALRVDTGDKKVELLYSKDYSDIENYKITYLKKPHPILLFLPTGGTGSITQDSIDGYKVYASPGSGYRATKDSGTTIEWSIETEVCELDSQLHRAIVTAAVQLAAAAYKA